MAFSGATDINTDASCGRTMDPDMVLSGSLAPFRQQPRAETSSWPSVAARATDTGRLRLHLRAWGVGVGGCPHAFNVSTSSTISPSHNLCLFSLFSSSENILVILCLSSFSKTTVRVGQNLGVTTHYNLERKKTMQGCMCWP